MRASPILLAPALVLLPLVVAAQGTPVVETIPVQPIRATPAATPAPADRSSPMSIRGYVQGRYSQRVSGDQGVDLWTDRSVGDRFSLSEDNNFLIRRGRLVFSRDMNRFASIYIQPDFASTAGGTGNSLQLRDAYADLFVDGDRVHRFRVGQSKVPYGWENLQSSQNRLTLDRADALNSGVRDERDTGVFYYYTPSWVQARFREIAGQNLKHSGNYGMLGVGFYNGQGANRQDRNDQVHTVVRLNLPLKAESGQLYEVGLQGYTGRFVPTVANYTGLDGANNTRPELEPGNEQGFRDERIALTAVMYQQPFGLQAEYTWGRTPGLNREANRIETRNLNGGYLQAMLQLPQADSGLVIPFVKYQRFDGANKAENNAPENRVRDWEIGVEWQLNPTVELTGVYHIMDRNNLLTGNRAGRPDYDRFRADYLRLQVQVSY